MTYSGEQDQTTQIMFGVMPAVLRSLGATSFAAPDLSLGFTGVCCPAAHQTRIGCYVWNLRSDRLTLSTNDHAAGGVSCRQIDRGFKAGSFRYPHPADASPRAAH